MPEIKFSEINVGDELPVLVKPAISRTILTLYAGGSGDHNPIHIDSDFARQAGMDDVFVHGMLGMAYLGQLLTNWVSQDDIREFSVRFGSITQVGAEMTCSGTVTEKFDVDGENRVRLSLQSADQLGDVKLTGEAVIALP